MVRDDELARLINYAKGLNIQVKFRSYDPKNGADAEWTTDGTEITIFKRGKTTKLDMVLSLIHELGHHLEHIHNNNRETDPKLEEAIGEDDRKKMRKRLYDWEIKGSNWWEIIYKETDLKFDIRRLRTERESDLWQYEVYYDTGNFPTRKQQREKRKELRRKYGYE